jgi:NAD(P)-dependent dehydrogenase (short-subunit alcohol dehydrogenase family)
MNRLSGKVAVITGGSSGIGRAAVKRFLEEGAAVVVADIRETSPEVDPEFRGQALFQHCDVTQESHIAAAMQAAVDAWGGLDIVVNNAGAPGALATIDEITAEAWDGTQALLLRSVALGIRHAATHMKARGSGTIINTASVAGLSTGMGPIAYSVAKAGVIQLTRVAAAELARFKIRVNAVCPGFIVTNIFGAAIGADAQTGEVVKSEMSKLAAVAQPVQKAGAPSHIADTFVFLASDESEFINGEHIVVDGGLTIGPRHSWDPNTPSPTREVLNSVLQQKQA